jgi:gliding motility-associated-like protein
MRIKLFNLIAFFFLICFTSFGQYNMATNNGQTITTCSGTFTDSGGSSSQYSNSENYTITFCSNNGLPLNFDFTTFDLDIAGDQLSFYNGTTATGTPIAVLDWLDDSSQVGTSSQLQIGTLSTCVTVKWTSNASNTDGGWVATVSCIAPPSCGGNPAAADIFGQATPICNLNSYCGNLSSYYGEDTPFNLRGGGDCPTPTDGIFGGSIENNSWLSFQASSNTATFDFNVPCGTDGIQVGIFGFDGSNFSLKSPCAITDGTNNGTFSVTGSNLTVCETYYIMIDGIAGATCNYSISANNGVVVSNAGADQTICSTSTNLTANAGTLCTMGNWSVISGTGNFTNINSSTSSVSGLSNGTNILRWTLTSSFCSSFDDVTITVNGGSATTIAYPSLSVANTVTAAQNITLTNGPVTGNYTATPTGLTINPTTGAVTPSTSAIGTYTISAPTACGTATATLAITAVPCGTCVLPNCPIFHNTSATTGSAIVSYPVCTTLSPVLTSGSFQTCYQVTTNANGNLGFRLSEDIRQNPLFVSDPTKQCNGLRADAIDATRTYTLIQSSSGCPGTPIPPSATNVAGSAIGFNPEWYGLLPNTNYTLCVTVSVPDNSCQLERLCMVYYHPNASCTTCATATCPATSITATTAALGQSGISTALTSAGNQLNISLINGQSATVCVPVTVPSGSTMLGFKHSIDLSSACAINNVTYQLKPASNCSGPALLPNRVNAQLVSSGFNPEWDNLTPGNYILCYTLSVMNAPAASCNGLPDLNGDIKSIDLLGLGYYNVIPPSCSTCATATCNVASITVATAPLGQTGIVTAIAAAGNNLGLSPLTAGQSVTVCVPVTVVANSTMLGFKQQFDVQMECLNPAIQVINYQLRPASNCNAIPIVPNRTNASSTSSGFNPEWDNLPVGNYVLCYTLNIVSISTTCNPVNLHGLGYYNVVPVTVPCQDYQIQLYDDDSTSIIHTGSTFSCTDPGVYLGPTADPTVYDSGLPYQNYNIFITALTGSLNNLVLNRYDAGTNVLAEALTVTPGQVVQNYFLRPAPGQYYKLDKTNAQSGTYSYTIVDVISGATVASGTWTITAGAESASSISLIPQGTANYSGSGVTNGFDVTGVNNYTNDRGIGFFNPSLAGAGTHTITYTWNNGLAAPNNCTLTRTKIVTVTGPSAPTTTNVSICTGTTATLTASAIATGATIKWYDASTGGNLLFTGNPFTTPTLTAATSYWVTQTTGGCESTRTQVTVSITPGTDATYTLNSTTCAPGSITFSSVSPAATTFDWISGPAGYTFPAGFTTPSTTNTNLTNLPAGTYCVDITSPNVAGGTVTTTLLTENFEANAPNWTINNSGGNNIFVINNTYAGGTCTVGGVPFAVPAVPNQGTWATAGPQSKYLHIKATTTCGFGCAESAFPPANANFCSTTSDQKFTLNTPLSTIGKTNVTVSFQYINKGTDVDDFGALEYSTNGGSTWTQAGANLTGKTAWFNQVTTLPAWNNQASLLFRFRWKNDASSSSDPPLCLDEIIVTAQETAVASCGSTKQECIVINPIVTPTISCGTSTINSVQFTWSAVAGVTSYTATHTINGGAAVNDGTITSPFTISGLNPNDAVVITITPVGGSGTCFGSVSLTCTANACPTILTPSANQTLCLGGDPTALSVSTTFTGANAISFVYFTTAQTGSAMYTGGTLLGNVTPSTGTANYNPGVLGTPGSLPNVSGTYFLYAIANPTPSGATCRPFQEIRVVVNSSPLIPTVTTTAATCLINGTASVSNYSAVLNYTSTPVGLTVSATGVISGFTCGTAYTITATNAATCSATSTSFTVQCQLAAPLVPTVTTTAATCLANGTATVSNYSSTETYTSTPSGLTVGAGGVVTGFTCGTAYTITATNAATCSSTSTSFTVQCQLAAPLVPTITTTAATCLVNGTATVSNSSSTETYTSTPTGLTVSATGVISGFTCGTAYTITATNAATCLSTSTSFTVQCQLPAPLVPTVTTTAATCLVNGTASVSNYSAALNYTSTPVGLTVSATGVISGFTCGTAYTITATNAATCSATSTSFTVQCQLAAPLVPTVTTTAATCLANGTATVSNYSSTETYTSTPSGLTVGAGGVVTGFTCGTPYTIKATNAATCSATSTSFTVQCQLAAPLVPSVTTTSATCSQSGSSTISNYNVALTYIFTPSGPIVSSTGLISGMTVGLSYTVIASNGGCLSAASISFSNGAQIVKPILNYTVTNPICDGNTLDFVLNSNIPGTTYVWSASNNELNGFIASGDQTNINQIVHLINPISTSGSISMIISPINNGCIGDPVAVTILVNPIPKITAITETDVTLCSGQNVNVNVTGEPSGITYNWTAVNVNGVAISGGIYNGTTTGNLNFQLTTTSLTTVGTIQFQMIPFRNGCYGAPVLSSVITVYPLPGNPIGLPHPAICSGEPTNINVSENLLITGTQLKWQVIASNNVTGFISSGIALAPISINHILINNFNIQGFVTYRITSVLGDCDGTFTDITVLVNPLPKPELIDGHICVNQVTGVTYQGYVLDTQLSDPNFNYDWYLLNTTTNIYVALPSGNGPTYQAMQPGIYKVIVTNTLTNCEQSDIASVVTVYPATGISAEVSEAFSDNATITITVNPIGTGNLIYSLDGGAWQDSNIFTNVQPGTHEVIVEDTEGCTNLAINVLVIDYPKYFTPNGDGIHETWNIIGLNQPDAKLYIFDRYGKLLKQLSPTGIGWDGTYIGAQLPSTDYWFTLDYSENGTQKQFKSHFSLKR